MSMQIGRREAPVSKILKFDSATLQTGSALSYSHNVRDHEWIQCDNFNQQEIKLFWGRSRYFACVNWAAVQPIGHARFRG